MQANKKLILILLIAIKLGLYFYFIDLSLFYWNNVGHKLDVSVLFDLFADEVEVREVRRIIAILMLISGLLLCRNILKQDILKKSAIYSIFIVVIIGVAIKLFTNGDVIYSSMSRLLGHNRLYAIIAITVIILFTTIENISFNKIIPPKSSMDNLDDTILDQEI